MRLANGRLRSEEEEGNAKKKVPIGPSVTVHLGEGEFNLSELRREMKEDPYTCTVFTLCTLCVARND